MPRYRGRSDGWGCMAEPEILCHDTLRTICIQIDTVTGGAGYFAPPMTVLMIYLNAWRALFIMATACAWMGAVQAQDGPQAKLSCTDLTAGMHVIRAELAATADEQDIGLKFRRGMGANDGMLFVYQDAAVRCFSMRNTWVPLTIAFVSSDGTVDSLADLAPMDLSSRCSVQPVQFALQLPQGWFAKRGFKPGMKLGGAPFTTQ
jgi:uncharacterized protein